jgi:hypothetical protein
MKSLPPRSMAGRLHIVVGIPRGRIAAPHRRLTSIDSGANVNGSATGFRFENDPGVMVREIFVACGALAIATGHGEHLSCSPANATRCALEIGSASMQSVGPASVSIRGHDLAL